MFLQAMVCSIHTEGKNQTGTSQVVTLRWHWASGVCRLGCPDCSNGKEWWINSHLWRSQSHFQSSCLVGYLSLTKSWRDVGITSSSWILLMHTYRYMYHWMKNQLSVFINMHKGLFQHNRLPFGTSSAPAHFKCTMEGILRSIWHIHVYTDDILITGESESEQFKRLDEILACLKLFWLKECNFTFTQLSVEHLGYNISPDSLCPTKGKAQVITEAQPDITCLNNSYFQV